MKGRARRAALQRRSRVSCTLALWALSTATAATASLAGTTLCLSRTSAVLASGVPAPDRMAERLYTEMKGLLRAQGVRFTEAPVCRGASADLTLTLDTTRQLGGGVETRVSGRVDDRSREGNSWLTGTRLRWSGVEYGRAGADPAEVGARLLNDAQTLLARLVGDWRAANP